MDRQLKEYIQSDLYRCTGKTSLRAFAVAMIRDKGFNYLFYLRCAQSKSLLKYPALPILAYKRIHSGINIGRYYQVGYGLYIGHGGPVVVNDSAVIGNNVNLSQCVTIGSNDGKAATIGDNVYIAPNVCVIEAVTIGSNATIGAGSVVTKDIPENATAVGNYARVINYNDPGRYVLNRWPVEKQDGIFKKHGK